MNLLITGAWQDAGANLERIRDLGHNVAFLQQEKDPVPCAADWVESVICNGLFLHHPIESFPNLKYIQLTSAGYDRVPLEYIRQHGIVIHNARGVYSIPMAEYAVGGVLELYRQFPAFRENQKKHLWEKRRNLPELAGKTVGIVGCGSVGSECAKRFSAFGCRVLGIATSWREQPFFDEVRGEDALDAVLSESDVVILTVPLTEKTYHLMNAERLAVMKRGAVFVNIARGGIVDTRALENALEQNHLAGAVLDVFEEEPLSPDSPLWDMEHVVITPHNSFVGDGVQERLAAIILKALSDLE
jgi:phosphoglycerate dehydrogenase-like enzyme